MIYNDIFCLWGNWFCVGGPQHGPIAAGDRKTPWIWAHERTVDFHVSHMGEQNLLLSPGYFTPAERRREGALKWWLPSLGVKYFMCSPFLNSSQGARCCHGLLPVAVDKLPLLASAALPAVSKMYFLICFVIILGLLFPPFPKARKRVHLTMKTGTNVFLLVGNNEKSERLMRCCCLFSTALLVTNYNGWDLLPASLNKLIM